MKKILIVGLGPMGIAHLKSFQSKSSKYQIFLSDLNMNKIAGKNLRLFKKFKNLSINDNLPKNLKFDVVIISTNSKERYLVIREIFNHNKVKNLFLEKFIFPNIKDFNLFKKLIKKKKIKNIFVNTWGDYLIRKLNIVNFLKRKKNLKIIININKGDMLTNLIHYFDMIDCLLFGNKFYLINKNIKLIRSKRKGYNEIEGSLSIRQGTNTIFLNSKFKKKFSTMEIIGSNLNYFIEIDNLGYCNLYEQKKIIKRIPFPFASKKTELWFNNFLLRCF